MEVTFSYIKNRIGTYRKDDLLKLCYLYLYKYKDKVMPIWFVFVLMKWTYLYAENKYPPKELKEVDFHKLLDLISKLNDSHLIGFLNEGAIDKPFQIMFYQQMYLQKEVFNEVFTTQLKLYQSLEGRYNIDHSFYCKTGLAIYDFVFISYLVYMLINIDKLGKPNLQFHSCLTKDMVDLLVSIVGKEKVESYLYLLMLNPFNPKENIEKFKNKINKTEFQSLEITFFTMFPFQLYGGKIRLIHKAVFNYTIFYYIYDFLKSNDNNFTTEFGNRFEKYIELGLKEIKCSYKKESQLKKMLPTNSNVVDYYLDNMNIFIECKAIELQPYPAVNPTNELLYSSLKDSIIKAYFKQLLTVSKYLNPNVENWGIILTYKELFWSQFSDLYKFTANMVGSEFDNSQMPPENVFIIDIYTWDKIIQLIKDKKTTLINLLEKAKLNNSKPETKKGCFDMHFQEFDIFMNLSYLQDELSLLKQPIDNLKNQK